MTRSCESHVISSGEFKPETTIVTRNSPGDVSYTALFYDCLLVSEEKRVWSIEGHTHSTTAMMPRLQFLHSTSRELVSRGVDNDPSAG